MSTTTGTIGARQAQTTGCVLVVEDDPLQRRVIGRLLRVWGYGIVEAGDGQAALEAFHATWNRVNVIVLDIMLPVLDGIEVARQIRAERPDLPIVACSAAFTPEVQSSLRGLGIRLFLPKPYSADALQSILRHLHLAEPPAQA